VNLRLAMLSQMYYLYSVGWQDDSQWKIVRHMKNDSRSQSEEITPAFAWKNLGKSDELSITVDGFQPKNRTLYFQV
jgi:hypothetical protein